MTESQTVASSPVKDWLDSCKKGSVEAYKYYFPLFEQYVDKSGEDLLNEAKANVESKDFYTKKLFEFYRQLANGSIKSRRGKTLSQNTCKTAVMSVRAFFTYHDLQLSFKKFMKKDARLAKPQVVQKKHFLVPSELQRLFRIASAREKAVLALGAMGQDRSTVARLKVEQFTGKLGATQLEFVDEIREKTNTSIKILLTPEVQRILADYIVSLKRHEGWLFEGYKNHHFKPDQCNDVFKALCEKAEVKDNGRRLSFHCLRMWFSTQLRNKVDRDIIDLLTGHEVRFGGAYLADDETKLRQLLTDENVQDLLQLQEGSHNGLSKDLEEQKAKLAEQAKTIENLQEELDAYKADMDAVRLKFPLTEEERARAKPFPIQKGAMKIREVKIYEPKKPPVVLDAVLREASPNVHDEIAELRREIEALKKVQKN